MLESLHAMTRINEIIRLANIFSPIKQPALTSRRTTSSVNIVESFPKSKSSGHGNLQQKPKHRLSIQIA